MSVNKNITTLLDVTSCSTSEMCRSFVKILLLPPGTIKSKQQIHSHICKFVPDCSALYFRWWKSKRYGTLKFYRRSNQISAYKLNKNNDTEWTCLIHVYRHEITTSDMYHFWILSVEYYSVKKQAWETMLLSVLMWQISEAK